MPVYQNIANTIGRAPLVKLRRIAAGILSGTTNTGERRLTPTLANFIRKEVAA
jgi:hypothetical protein